MTVKEDQRDVRRTSKEGKEYEGDEKGLRLLDGDAGLRTKNL